jgi:hypothetical protein
MRGRRPYGYDVLTAVKVGHKLMFNTETGVVLVKRLARKSMTFGYDATPSPAPPAVIFSEEPAEISS